MIRSFPPVQPGLGPLPAFHSYPSYGVGMNPVASAGFGVPTSGTVIRPSSGSMASGAAPSRVVGSNTARGTQPGNDQESAIRGFLQEAGVDESVLAGSYSDMVQAMRGLQRNNGGV